MSKGTRLQCAVRSGLVIAAGRRAPMDGHILHPKCRYAMSCTQRGWGGAPESRGRTNLQSTSTSAPPHTTKVHDHLGPTAGPNFWTPFQRLARGPTLAPASGCPLQGTASSRAHAAMGADGQKQYF